MNFLKTVTPAAAVLTLLASGTVLQAQSLKGSFDLPYQAHWGFATLTPGHYQYSIPPASSWPELIVLVKDGKVVKLRAAYEQVKDPKSSSELVLTQANGTAVVTDLNFGPQGKSFHFAVPKDVRTQIALNGKGSGKVVTLAPRD